MAWLSVQCLRRLHPNWRVVVLTDCIVTDAVSPMLKKICGCADEVIHREISLENVSLRSRWLKTSMRSLISGDFLFIDCDAFPLSPLDKLVTYRSQVCAALDLNLPPRQFSLHPQIKKIYDDLGWHVPARYFNSGVMFWPDTAEAAALGERWHQLWKKSIEIGCTQDQPSLNVAIEDLGTNVEVLPRRYNAMVERKSWGYRRPAIMHFLKHDSAVNTVLHNIVQDTLQATEHPESLDDFFATGYPWVNRNSVSRQLACGNYAAALKVLFKKALSR